MQQNDVIFTIIFTTLVITLLIGAMIFIIIKANKDKIKQQMKLAQLQLTYQQELRVVEGEVRDQTMTNVARELHDNIGQLLTFMKLQIEQQKLDDHNTETILNPIDETLNNVYTQVSMLSRSLNAERIAEQGLAEAIEREIKKMSSLKAYQLHWQYDGCEPELTKDQQLVVLRIFQELMNNIFRHAQATNIYITLNGDRDFLFSIKDDGKGFPLQEMQQSAAGSGLRNILKRTDLSGLSCIMQSNPGEGAQTVISIKQPLAKA